MARRPYLTYSNAPMHALFLLRDLTSCEGASVMHSFLLNRENEVVVVGDPARNAKVKELMLER